MCPKWEKDDFIQQQTKTADFEELVETITEEKTVKFPERTVKSTKPKRPFNETSSLVVSHDDINVLKRQKLELEVEELKKCQ